MSTELQTQAKVAPAKPSLTPVQDDRLQRECSCGASSSGGGCEPCRKRQSSFQRFPANRTVSSALLRSLAATSRPTVQRYFGGGKGVYSGHNFGQVVVYTRTAEPRVAVYARISRQV